MAKKNKLGSDPLSARRQAALAPPEKRSGLDALIRGTGSKTAARRASEPPQREVPAQALEKPEPEAVAAKAEMLLPEIIETPSRREAEIKAEPVSALEPMAEAVKNEGIFRDEPVAEVGKPADKTGTTASETGQYLGFRLGKELFALDITNVREIIEFRGVTRLPKMPEMFFGVINLRGGALPVMDIKKKLGIESSTLGVEACVIIVEPEIEGYITQVGILVDAVSEVMELSGRNIKPAPKIGMKLNTSMLKGIGVRDHESEEFVLILELDKIFSREEITTALDASAVKV